MTHTHNDNVWLEKPKKPVDEKEEKRLRLRKLKQEERGAGK